MKRHQAQNLQAMISCFDQTYDSEFQITMSEINVSVKDFLGSPGKKTWKPIKQPDRKIWLLALSVFANNMNK